nr:stage III sporulation protein AE [Eubacteriales bacterium]
MQKRRYVLIVFILMLTAFFIQYEVFAEDESDKISPELQEELERLSNELDLAEWQKYYDELHESYSVLGEYDGIMDLVEGLASGSSDIGFSDIGQLLKELFLPGLKDALTRMIGMVALGVLSGICAMSLGEDRGTKQVLLLIITGTAILLLTGYFALLAGEAKKCVEKVSSFCSVAAPVMLGLLTSLGCAGSARLLSPTMIVLSNIILSVIGNIIIPLLLAGGILSIINGLTDKMKLSRSIKFINSTVKWVLGLMTTVYIAVNTIEGLTAGTADRITLRTTRYAIDKLIPAVGGMVSGAVDAVIGGAVILKNAVGLAAILIIAAIVIRPIMMLIAGMLSLRISSAIIEPFAEPGITGILDGNADTISYLFAAVSAAASMFIVNIMVIMSLGNTLVG